MPPTDLQPLTSQESASQRGNTVTLGPREKGPKRIIEFNSICVRGELLGITLGICEEAGKCCPPADECADQPFALSAVRAHLEWGIGNACFTAQADFLNGTTIAVIAEQLKVCADYIVWGDRNADWLPCYRVSAGAGYVARSSNSNPARLTKRITVAAGARAEVKIPNFAISMTVQPIDAAPGVTLVGVLGPCGPRVSYEVVTPLTNLGQHNVENALPLFNGATRVEIDNTAGLTPLTAFIIFGLAL